MVGVCGPGQLRTRINIGLRLVDTEISIMDTILPD